MITELQQQLGIDSTFFYQFAIFIFIFIWLKIVYFSPFLKLIQRREKSSIGAWDEVQKLDEESLNLEKNYEMALITARKKASAERDESIARARKSANESIAVSREEAKSKIEKSREIAAKNAESEFTSLRAQASGLAALLIQKLTNTKVGL